MQKTYKLAKESEYAVNTFGPFLTLKQAESYRDQINKAGFNVLVVNCASHFDYTLFKRKVWTRFSLLTM